MDICKNCDAALLSTYRYCPQCSQNVKLHRLSLHEILHEAIHYFTHADKGIFQLLKELFQKNGVVAREYVQGRRKKYFPPLNFFLLVAALHVFSATLLETDQRVKTTEVRQSADTEAVKQTIRMERLAGANHFLNRYGNITAMFVIPMTALILFLFYSKGRYNYTEHLIACMYMAGFCILIYALVILPFVKLTRIPDIYGAVAFFMLQVGYFSLFYYRFFEKQTLPQFLKIFVANFVAVASWFFISAAMVLLYMATGFWGVFGEQ